MAPLIVRVDAGPGIGSGHLIRSLALADAWGEPATFLMHTPDPRVSAAGATAIGLEAASAGSDEDAAQTVAVATRQGAEWIVVDGYAFGPRFHRAIRAAGFRTLCIDDEADAEAYPADVVLNQNLHARRELYGSVGSDTELLLGPRFVLLRPQFSEFVRSPKQVPDRVRRILVTLGGGTDDQLLTAIVHGIARSAVDDLEMIVLSGDVPVETIRAAAGRLAASARIFPRTDRMRELMTDCDLAISAGGSTTWELAYMGIPSLLLAVAANQVRVLEESAARGIAVALGAAERLAPTAVAGAVTELAIDRARRERMHVAGMQLIDGQGAHRVAAVLREHRSAASRTEIGRR